eukprot:snap_masked-scaffold875_size86197-processed-gene-0.8 protein:Tk03496 transcript:snap_masked-scaffold875_size86197-processed-gene-0.8-mRNA-1 annotation:"GK17855"
MDYKSFIDVLWYPKLKLLPFLLVLLPYGSCDQNLPSYLNSVLLDQSRSQANGNAPMMGMPYRFSYGVDDASEMNFQSRSESSDGTDTVGEYRVLLPNGQTQIVQYKSNAETGFLVDITYENDTEIGKALAQARPQLPDSDSPRSPSASNINNVQTPLNNYESQRNNKPASQNGFQASNGYGGPSNEPNPQNGFQASNGYRGPSNGPAPQNGFQASNAYGGPSNGPAQPAQPSYGSPQSSGPQGYQPNQFSQNVRGRTKEERPEISRAPESVASKPQATPQSYQGGRGNSPQAGQTRPRPSFGATKKNGNAGNLGSRPQRPPTVYGVPQGDPVDDDSPIQEPPRGYGVPQADPIVPSPQRDPFKNKPKSNQSNNNNRRPNTGYSGPPGDSKVQASQSNSGRRPQGRPQSGSSAPPTSYGVPQAEPQGPAVAPPQNYGIPQAQPIGNDQPLTGSNTSNGTPRRRPKFGQRQNDQNQEAQAPPTTYGLPQADPIGPGEEAKTKINDLVLDHPKSNDHRQLVLKLHLQATEFPKHQSKEKLRGPSQAMVLPKSLQMGLNKILLHHLQNMEFLKLLPKASKVLATTMSLNNSPQMLFSSPQPVMGYLNLLLKGLSVATMGLNPSNKTTLNKPQTVTGYLKHFLKEIVGVMVGLSHSSKMMPSNPPPLMAFLKHLLKGLSVGIVGLNPSNKMMLSKPQTVTGYLKHFLKRIPVVKVRLNRSNLMPFKDPSPDMVLPKGLPLLRTVHPKKLLNLQPVMEYRKHLLKEVSEMTAVLDHHQPAPPQGQLPDGNTDTSQQSYSQDAIQQPPTSYGIPQAPPQGAVGQQPPTSYGVPQGSPVNGNKQTPSSFGQPQLLSPQAEILQPPTDSGIPQAPPQKEIEQPATSYGLPQAPPQGEIQQPPTDYGLPQAPPQGEIQAPPTEYGLPQAPPLGGPAYNSIVAGTGGVANDPEDYFTSVEVGPNDPSGDFAPQSQPYFSPKSAQGNFQRTNQNNRPAQDEQRIQALISHEAKNPFQPIRQAPSFPNNPQAAPLANQNPHNNQNQHNSRAPPRSNPSTRGYGQGLIKPRQPQQPFTFAKPSPRINRDRNGGGFQLFAPFRRKRHFGYRKLP